MIINLEDFNNSAHRELIILTCDFCKKEFSKVKKDILHNNKPSQVHFCSKECKRNNTLSKSYKQIKCKNCKKIVLKHVCELNQYKNSFCCQSCVATYNNLNKNFGYNRSKLEIFIEKALQELYPEIIFDFNKKDAINSELDIYIPSLKLAFELNGIFHYEPIYGQKVLERKQNNDQRKSQACYERGIEFCTIDTSQQKYFKPESSLKYLKIITDIIDMKLKMAEQDLLEK